MQYNESVEKKIVTAVLLNLFTTATHFASHGSCGVLENVLYFLGSAPECLAASR